VITTNGKCPWSFVTVNQILMATVKLSKWSPQLKN